MELINLGTLKDEAIKIKRQVLHGKTSSELIGIMQIELMKKLIEKNNNNKIDFLIETLIEFSKNMQNNETNNLLKTIVEKLDKTIEKLSEIDKKEENTKPKTVSTQKITPSNKK